MTTVTVLGRNDGLGMALGWGDLAITHVPDDSSRRVPATVQPSDIVVMADGGNLVDACRRLLSRSPATRIIVVGSRALEILPELLNCGVVGIVAEEAPEALRLAIACASAGATFVPSDAMRATAATVLAGWAAHHNRYGLTGKEMTVWRLIGAGMSNGQIAERLDRSRATVRTHVQHLHAKLQTSTREELVDRWQRWERTFVYSP